MPKHQHLGTAAALLVCATGATGCSDVQFREPTEEEREMLLQSWKRVPRSMDFIRAVSQKADPDIFASREDTMATREGFLEDMHKAFGVAEAVVTNDRFFIYDGSQYASHVAGADAFFRRDAEGPLIAFNQTGVYWQGGEILGPMVDPTIFLHEGSHFYHHHSDEVNAISMDDGGLLAEAVVEQHDFAYELTQLGQSFDIMYMWLYFDVADLRGFQQREHSDKEVRHFYERHRENLGQRSLEDFIEYYWDEETRAAADVYGITKEELMETFQETGVFEEAKQEILREFDREHQDWKEGKGREIVAEREQELRAGRGLRS